MQSTHTQTDAPALARAILAGEIPASAAIGRPDAYDHLNAGANGPLPFLGSSSKIEAGESVGILSSVLYMLAGNDSGRESCAHRTKGCTKVCLVESVGHMSMNGPRVARRRRHACFLADRNRFLADLHLEIVRHVKRAQKQGKIPAIRLNGTTDLPWHRMRFTAHDGASYPCLHVAVPDARFYEYTKFPLSIARKGGVPDNLHFTFSVSESELSDARACEYLDAGYSAAVVTHTKRHIFPPTFTLSGVSYPTTDGDAHDARFLDPAGHVVILAAKGRAIKDTTSGFVRNV